MPGTFARAIAQETGWAATEIYFGLTIAMLMMAMLSPFVSRLLARFGGQRVVVTGTLMISAGCLIMAYVQSLPGWLATWVLTGAGMRLALYDALFAALVNIYGQSARLTISRVTLAGGLASALFWPLGAGLLTQMDWRACAADLCLVWPAQRDAAVENAKSSTAVNETDNATPAALPPR